MSQPLKVISLPGSHDQIIKITAQLAAGKLLDCPCGTGALTQRLALQGHDVHCCDIDAGHFQLSDQFPLELADLNRDRLSFVDNSFDYIVCANGLHRLFYPQNALREFSRIIKENGKLILSWPNYNSMARRVKYLFSGSLGTSIDFATYDQTITDPATKVRYPLSASRMEYLLSQVGIKIDDVYSGRLKSYDYLLMPLAALTAFSSKCTSGKLNNHSKVVIGGGTTIVSCTKVRG